MARKQISPRLGWEYAAAGGKIAVLSERVVNGLLPNHTFHRVIISLAQRPDHTLTYLGHAQAPKAPQATCDVLKRDWAAVGGHRCDRTPSFFHFL